jgi:FkbM family methyltransferase
MRLTTLRDGARLDLKLGDWPQAQAFLLGEYDLPTVEFCARHLHPDGVFVDAGAHVGLITMQVLQRNPSATVHAFEPHPHRVAQLRRNIELNGHQDHVRINAAGLSDGKGALGFDLDEHRISETAAAVEVMRLDDYAEGAGIDRIDVLKLDIEGHEIQALEGAEKLFREGSVKAVTLEAMEAHGDTAAPRKFLEGFDFQPVPMPGRSASPNEGYLRP